MKKKKSAKEVIETVEPAKVVAPEIIVSKVEQDEVLHYYRCNVTMDNGKNCNCSAFM